MKWNSVAVVCETRNPHLLGPRRKSPATPSPWASSGLAWAPDLGSFLEAHHETTPHPDRRASPNGYGFTGTRTRAGGRRERSPGRDQSVRREADPAAAR